MIIIKNIKEWQAIRQQIELENSIGFVPTMGCLHQGHASLIERSIRENKKTILSIFVNPTQFNSASDYQHYPKTLKEDLVLAENLNVDYVLLPNESQIYSGGNNICFTVNEPIAKVLEGKYRPGHFNGVLTVVMKLFQLVQPQRAYFGEKDYQQYILIKKMVEDYFLPIEVIPCPIIREASGLPYSSRNTRLSPEQRHLAEEATVIIHSAKSIGLTRCIAKLENLGIKWDYLEQYDNRFFYAIYIGSIRLIDNFVWE